MITHLTQSRQSLLTRKCARGLICVYPQFIISFQVTLFVCASTVSIRKMADHLEVMNPSDHSLVDQPWSGLPTCHMTTFSPLLYGPSNLRATRASFCFLLGHISRPKQFTPALIRTLGFAQMESSQSSAAIRRFRLGMYGVVCSSIRTYLRLAT